MEVKIFFNCYDVLENGVLFEGASPRARLEIYQTNSNRFMVDWMREFRERAIVINHKAIGNRK